MIRIVFSAFVCALMSLSGGVVADGKIAEDKVVKNKVVKNKVAKDKAVDASQQLQTLLGKIETLKAGFTQKVADTAGQLIQQFNGELSIKKPGKLYWESYEPMVQTVVTNGETLWYYDADLEQLTVRSAAQEVGYTPAMILSGSAEHLGEHYRVTVVNVQDKGYQFTLTPVKAGELFERLTMTFSSQHLTEISMYDSLDQQTTVTLHDVLLNQPVDDGVFVFNPPPGTEILKQE